MTFPNETLGFLVVGFSLIVSSLIAFLSWRYADYFLSRRDHYVNSKYQLFIKKIGWSISAFFVSLGLIAGIVQAILK